nr:beta-N-acetylhexosaminidase [Lysobacter sp. CAU 1642]
MIIGINGQRLADNEREWLAHPAVAGVILFSRNFASRSQLIELVAELRAAAQRPIVICVDQEGGRVQRFRDDGFVALPPLAALESAGESEALAEQHAWLMASEVLACGVDLSFAPVVDLGRGNLAIGDRALSADPRQVSRLALAYLRGMHAAGMASTLKHFPGHGSVREDTHFDAAIDPRPLEALREADLLPFQAGIEADADAVMLAHVTYPEVDAAPAGYSRRWIQDILRGEMGFAGVVISDDIGMAAAESAGGVAARIRAHFDAGCDIVLVCTPSLVPEALAGLPEGARAKAEVVGRLAARRQQDWLALSADPRHQRARDALRPLQEASA